MNRLELKHGVLNYTDEGEGVPLVLLHANPGSHRDYDAVRPALAKRYRVISLDWPGYGESSPFNPASDSSCFSFYQVFVEFMDKLNIESAIIIGNSVSGYVAARFAAEFPDRAKALVLVAPGGFTRLNVFSRIFCRLQASSLSVPPSLLARFYIKHRTPISEQILSRAQQEQSTNPSRQVNRSVWQSFIDPNYYLADKAQAINSPCLLLFGKYDPIISHRSDGIRAKNAIAGSEMQVLESGHMPFAETPEVFLERLEGFLGKLEGS